MGIVAAGLLMIFIGVITLDDADVDTSAYWWARLGMGLLFLGLAGIAFSLLAGFSRPGSTDIACPHCGKPVRHGATRCRHCGVTLTPPD